MSLAELELISCSDCDVLYRPEISCLCHIDVILPVATDTDEAPAFECRCRFFATFILILSVHIRIERAGHLVRIVDVEVDTILTGLDRNIVSIILEVFHRATPVGAPGCVKTELELSSSSNVDIGIEILRDEYYYMDWEHLHMFEGYGAVVLSMEELRERFKYDDEFDAADRAARLSQESGKPVVVKTGHSAVIADMQFLYFSADYVV